ncbi:hypothetical protein ACHAXR_008808 [Thalassiosira sp. AJA248-18]
MTKKMRGFTKDGWVRVQRTVLRRVVGDRLQALLRGDFYVRNHLGEEDYEPLVREVEGLSVAAVGVGGASAAAAATTNAAVTASGEKNGTNGLVVGRSVAAGEEKDGGGANSAAAANGSAAEPQPQSPPEPPKFTPELETFIQLIAASIMIDASMRGENAGESDTRFIKKKKKFLARTLAGPKLGDFQNEVLRFDRIKRGEEFEEEEIVESEETRDSSEEESESESEEEEVQQQQVVDKKKKKKKGMMKPAGSAKPQQQHMSFHTHHQPTHSQREPTTHHHHSGAGESSCSSEDEEEQDQDSTISDTNTSNTSTADGFSTSATSSKHNQKKKERKRMKKEKKKEKKRMKRERKRREKEEEKKKRRTKRKAEKERAKKASKRRKKGSSGGDNGGGEGASSSLEFAADNELLSDDDGGGGGVNNGGDNDESTMDWDRSHDSQLAHKRKNDDNEDGDDDDEPRIYEVATKDDFEQYKADLLSRVPKSVKSRFREGGFSRWGKDWLPVLELGPFDVEPGPVREMWLEMFDNTQENGRDMTRLVFWYGVKFEDRGQAYSFVQHTKLINYEEGQRKGFCKMPKKIQKKIEKKQKLTKTEEQIRRGLKEIEGDMGRDKPDRAAWMMKFKEDYELAEEEAAQEEADKKVKSMSVGEEDEVAIPKKRKPGRPKKEESVDKPIKRKPGRPKKVVDVAPPEEDDDEVEIPKKRKPGRPKKSEKEKAERAAEKAAAKAAAKAKKKESTAKKWVIVDEDQESEMETEDDDDDRDYDDVDSVEDVDMVVDGEDDDSDVEKSSGKKRKASTSEKKSKKKAKAAMTEEEKAIERRAKAAEYREKKARERAEEQGIPYVKGRVGRKSKQTMLEEEQLKFTKCEEVFLPMMERLTEAKDTPNFKVVLKCINSIMERVELMTPPFLREYPLGMLVKTVRKSFEGEHPDVKDRCKRLTVEMKRVYTEKDSKIPDGFEPVKNKKSTPTLKEEDQDQESSSSVVPDSVKSEKVAVKSEKVAVKPEKAVVKTEKVAVKSEKVDTSFEQSIPKRNNSEMSLSEPMPRKLAAASSSECLPDAVKPEPPQPKQKKTFSIKGMFEKPKPAKPKIAAHTHNMVVSGQPSPKPKSSPSWVTGPAMKMENFHEQHAKERSFGLEFLVDAASRVTSSSSAKKFDPVSVSQSFELAIFAETKLRGRDWQQYWEKIHDVVAMLSPGKDKRNAILQGIISGDYQEPSELVKLSRREIQSLNQLQI